MYRTANKEALNGPDNPGPSAAKSLRQRWMSAFARTSPDVLSMIMGDIDAGAEFSVVRPAEGGLVMVRARAGGTGQKFNMGEMTVTRCSVRSGTGEIGHGYIAGRDKRHAEIAARLDAMMQALPTAQSLSIVERLEQEIMSAADARQQRSAPTKVDFFTMARGEDA